MMHLHNLPERHNFPLGLLIALGTQINSGNRYRIQQRETGRTNIQYYDSYYHRWYVVIPVTPSWYTRAEQERYAQRGRAAIPNMEVVHTR